MNKSPIDIAIDLVGTRQIAVACGVTVQAVTKWKARKRLPRTEWTGETNYSAQIEALTESRVTREQLLFCRSQEQAA